MTAPLEGLRAITFDFGNTLVPVDRSGLRRVIEITARAVIERCGPFGYDDFMRIWAEERERQFREEVPRFREVDLAQRVVRVLARLRGLPPPGPDERWDDERAGRRSVPDEIAFAVETYSRAFVEAMPAPPLVGPLLERLARRHHLAVLSNWPLAGTIDRYVEAAGWAPHFVAIVVSQRIGAIKPHEAIFRAAERALGLTPADGSAILHVGDDWVADVVGAKHAGWRAAFLHGRPEDSPLPSSERDEAVAPDLELSDLRQLEALLAP